MSENKITCRHLWKRWEKNDPNGYLVAQAQEKIRSYSKDDWQEISDDAREIMQQISLLVQEDIDVLDPRSEQAFQRLLDHVRKYFFEPNKEYIKHLYFATLIDQEYRQFFDQFKDGMSKKILQLIDTYPEKFN